MMKRLVVSALIVGTVTCSSPMAVRADVAHTALYLGGAALVLGAAALNGLNYHANQPVARSDGNYGAYSIPSLPAVPMATMTVPMPTTAAVYSMAAPVTTYQPAPPHYATGPAVLYVSAAPVQPLAIQQVVSMPPRTKPVD